MTITSCVGKKAEINVSTYQVTQNQLFIQYQKGKKFSFGFVLIS